MLKLSLASVPPRRPANPRRQWCRQCRGSGGQPGVCGGGGGCLRVGGAGGGNGSQAAGMFGLRLFEQLVER